MNLLERRRALMAQSKRKSKNLFNASLIPSNNYITNNGDGSFSVKAGAYSRSTSKRLSQLCPNLKEGDIATLSGVSNGYKMIKAGPTVWRFGEAQTITEAMLGGTVYIYANEKLTVDDIITVKNIQIELGTVATEYEPYY